MLIRNIFFWKSDCVTFFRGKVVIKIFLFTTVPIIFFIFNVIFVFYCIHVVIKLSASDSFVLYLWIMERKYSDKSFCWYKTTRVATLSLWVFLNITSESYFHRNINFITLNFKKDMKRLFLILIFFLPQLHNWLLAFKFFLKCVIEFHKC